MRTWTRSCFFAISFLSLPTFAALKTVDICRQKHCEIVVDAGSTGTRFYLYTLNLKDFSETYEMTLLDKQSIDKPLNNYHDEQLFAVLDDLFHDYKPEAIQVYMYATEGLRSLSLKERNQRFALIQKWFNNHSKLLLKELRILGGDEEGILLWLANAVELVKDHQIKSVDDTAVIEIGGGSAQIAIAIKQHNFESNNHVYPIHFLGQTIKIWTTSFPNLGINHMKAAFEENPNCYPKNYPMMNQKLGRGDIGACIAGMKQYKQSHGISTQDEVVKTRNLLQKEVKTHHWYGFGVPDYMGKSPILNFTHQHYSLAELQSRANKNACMVDWALQDKAFPKLKYKERVCFSSAYITWFAEDLLNLPPSTNIYYHNIDESLGWSKGSVIKRHTVV